MKRIFAFITSSTLSVLFVFPIVASAQLDTGRVGNFATSITNFISEILVPLILAIAFLVFIWGIFRYFILGGDDETEREKGKSLMLWGIVGFVVIITIVGIVNLLANFTGLDDAQEFKTPTIQGGG